MKNEKIKRNIAGLLALIQLGLVAGCSSKKPQNDNSETLAVIEELQDANASLEEKVDDLGQQIDAVSLELDGVVETIANLEEPDNETTEDLETSSVEMEETDSDTPSISADEENKDEENITEVVDGNVVEFNEDLLKELGIDFNISQDETIQNNIATLNDFLSNFQNISYSVETDYNAEKGHVENEITFENSNDVIAKILFNKFDGNDTFLSIRLYSNYMVSTENFILPKGANMNLSTSRSYSGYDTDSISETWTIDDVDYSFTDSHLYTNMNNNERFLKSVTFNYRNYETGLDQIINLNLRTNTNEYMPLGEDINVPDDATYTLKFTVAHQETEYIEVNITAEEYDTLYNIMQTNKFGAVDEEIKNALIEIIQKYASEEESKPLIEMLNGTYTRQR